MIDFITLLFFKKSDKHSYYERLHKHGYLSAWQTKVLKRVKGK